MLVSFECLKQMQFQLIIISQSEPLLVSFTDHSMIASVVTLRENSGMNAAVSMRWVNSQIQNVPPLKKISS